jgi:hypothetical protein
MLLWTAICAIPASYGVWHYFAFGGGPCPGLNCGFTAWVLILVGGVWLAVVGLVLYLWYRAGREAWLVVIGAVVLAVLGLLSLLNVL